MHEVTQKTPTQWLVWCENKTHGTKAHAETSGCLWPHFIGPSGKEPVVGHPYTVHD